MPLILRPKQELTGYATDYNSGYSFSHSITYKTHLLEVSCDKLNNCELEMLVRLITRINITLTELKDL